MSIASIDRTAPDAATPAAHIALSAKIRAHTARVGVVGLGYVGLPLAVECAKVGFFVCGYDHNSVRVDQVNAGLNYIGEVVDADLAEVVDGGRLRASRQLGTLDECDVIVICVPTPLTPNRDPDVSAIRNVGASISAVLRRGQLVCLESTTYPGTTEEVLVPLLARSGLAVGDDYFVVFSPERVDLGNAVFSTKNSGRVIGGISPACLAAGTTFYAQTFSDVRCVSAPRVAEMTKVFENTFRAVNIALVNEMALLCDQLGISVWEVIDAAATKPFGLMRFDPGPGVGGHCIPLDPFYLAWRARAFDFNPRFIELAGEINASMPYFVREKVLRTLNTVQCPIADARILGIGVAYKRDISDTRESPAIKVLELLERDGARVAYHDPHVSRLTDGASGKERHSTPLTAAALAAADCVVILTDHTSIDWRTVVDHAPRIVDTRNATRTVADRPNVVLL